MLFEDDYHICKFAEKSILHGILHSTCALLLLSGQISDNTLDITALCTSDENDPFTAYVIRISRRQSCG